MEENNIINGKVQLDARDIEIIDRYRKKKDTSVLTIMFTDIKEFTRLTEEMGDVHSNKVRTMHDEILTKTVEENDAGKVLKKIGDSIMAIFSEPSTAVEKALIIQEKLRELNKNSADASKILVRIGMNMGQVTVEDNVNMDVFGHVVNRAARIKDMADGGHIYLSYTVFDSAKGWILAQPEKKYAWKSHGYYFVKGVDDPLEVYEVFDKNKVKPKPPIKGRKKRSVPKLATSLGLLAIGAAAAIFILFFQLTSTSVVFRNVHLNTKLYMDNKKEIVLDGETSQELRPSLTRISPGNHVIYYTVSYIMRYYADIKVLRCKNIIEPGFYYNQMPGLSRYLTFSKGEKNKKEASETYKYLIFGKDNKKEDSTAVIHFIIQAKADKKDAKKIIFDYDFDVTLNGKEISKKHMTDDNTGAGTEAKRVNSVIYEDNYHYYFANYYISQSTTELNVGASYIEYK